MDFEIALNEDRPGNPKIKVFDDHVAELESLVSRLLPFDVLCIMRERTSMSAALLDRLPNLKLIASTGSRNAAIDTEAAKRLGIEVLHTGYDSTPTIEFTWALILALTRNVVAAIDVFDLEPLPAEHPFRHLQNVLATPHLGYCSRSLYETFYKDSVANISSWFLRNAGRLK